MLRSITAFAIGLALAGAAHAQEQQIAVSLHGKSHARIRTELYRAAVQVCGDDVSIASPFDRSCVEATYEDALRQAHTLLQPAPTALVQPPPPSLR